jgi:hypothetical protein
MKGADHAVDLLDAFVIGEEKSPSPRSPACSGLGYAWRGMSGRCGPCPDDVGAGHR